MSNRWRWWVVLAVIAGIAVPVGTIVVARRPSAGRRAGPMLPGVVDVLPTVDRAIADTAAAVGGAAAIALAGLTPATACRVGGRAGAVYTRKLDIYLGRGDEEQLVAQIAARLPVAYRPHREQPVAGAVGALTAAPGPGVSLTVRQLGEGWLTATAQTDCRAGGTDGLESSSPEPAATDTVAAILTRLHASVGLWNRRQLACPTGTLATTVAISTPTDSDGLPARLAEAVPATAHGYQSDADRLAYRDGPTSVVVAPTDDGGAVTVRYTTAC